MQLNSTNFFRWFTGSVDEAKPFPRLGITDAKIYLPQLVALEQTGFFINSDIPFYDTDTALELRILGGTAIGAVSKVTLDLGYRIYASFILPNLPTGQYQYQIYNTATNTEKCRSNYFQVIDPVQAETQTVKVKHRNSRDAYYFNWSLVPDFYCEYRLNLSLAGYQPEETIDQTKAVSTGIRRNNNYDTDLSYKLSTYYFDDGANLACIALFKCSELILNGKNYIQKTAYLPNARAISGVAIGEIELYDQYFSRINKFGQLPALVVQYGVYVLANNSPNVWTIKVYSQGNVLLSTVPVPANTTKSIQVKDLQLNSYIKINAETAGTYTVQNTNTLPDGTWTSSVTTVTTTAQSAALSQNAIYDNEYVVVIK